jgi:hypothetical protein
VQWVAVAGTDPVGAAAGAESASNPAAVVEQPEQPASDWAAASLAAAVMSARSRPCDAGPYHSSGESVSADPR